MDHARPCDAGLGRQGQVTIRLVVVVVVVVALAVVVFLWRLLLSVGEGGEEGTMPSYPCDRQHGRIAALSTCKDTSYSAGTP